MVDISIDTSNLDSYSDETALVNKIKEGLTAAAEPGATIAVVIQSIQVTTVYGNLPQLIVDDIAKAVKAMSNVAYNQITVNGNKHTWPFPTRRLAQTATCVTTVNNTDGVDVVTAAKNIHSSQTADAFSTQLQTVNAAVYENVSSSSLSYTAPTLGISASSTVQGTATAPTAAAVQTSVANATNATVTASVTTSGGGGSPSPSPSPTSTSGKYVPDGDHAPIAPMITIWAVAYAFAMY
jgi:hypothetical protein